MKQTIYVDVLIIINIYINYGLLLLTCYAVRRSAERLKILLAALFGGIYSLIILIPGISDTAVSVSRVPALAVMVLLSFGFVGAREYLKAAFAFLGVNLIFAGAMFLLWFFLCPQNMYFNGGIVYFGIDALTLVLLTVGAYLIIRLVSVFTRSRVPHNLIYAAEFYLSGRAFRCRALYDSGNSLCDPFSGEGVIIVHIDVFKDIVKENIFDDLGSGGDISFKLIPVKSVSGARLLPSFRLDRAVLRSAEKAFSLEKPVVALCREKIHGGEYGALLYSAVFDNTYEGKGEINVLHN